MKKKKIGIFLFDKVEILDFAGPYEVFSCTKISEINKHNTKKIFFSPFKIVTISEKGKIITTTGGLKVKTDFSIKDHPKLDILLIPGGLGTRDLIKNKKILDWVIMHRDIEILCSVCTGSLILAKAGLLKNKYATTHRSAFNILKELSPSTKIVKNKRYVHDVFYTAAGVSAGIDLSLKIVEEFYGRKIAKNTVKYMEYSSN